ncbi:hypothetical protein GPECTOR_7g1136 [Gonium pectorale]|uniref:Guanylate cyclase domain-containing protein n=1 Tax=Gonium pectorale TaxID=33097 RepID=A0A150GU32_GONPE|nr:hypothetical protein GPECTOR_7g1136 [Gonium pectorale]|eukprot:KXZ53242.1 hypothetical protein GPECTOR_7g1136 [Gonium pectorale]
MPVPVPVDPVAFQPAALRQKETAIRNDVSGAVDGAEGASRGVGGLYHSTSGLPRGAGGSPGVHQRGAVRRQLNALKRPLSRSSTRTYLMTALPTSTLNVLGRVHSQRAVNGAGSSGEEEETGGHASSATGGVCSASGRLRGRTSVVSEGLAGCRSNSLQLSAAEPRLAVPRIFSFMRASKRMLELQQAAVTEGGGVTGTRTPPRRHASAGSSEGSNVGGAGMGSFPLSQRERPVLHSAMARMGRESASRSPTSLAQSGPSSEAALRTAAPLGRVRGQEDADHNPGVRMVSPREMTPVDMARRVGMAWHEVAATSFTDPVTGTRVVALVQNDVSEKVETEMQLTELMEIFPRHVLEYIAMQNISGVCASMGNQGRRQRRKSQFDLLKSHDCSQLAHHHEQITILFCDVKGFTAMCSSVEPAVVMSFLNCLYTQFDSLLYVHDVYKGDCYMVAGGLVRRGADGVAALLEPGEVDTEHARKVVNFAKAVLSVVKDMRMPNGQPLQVRVGIHSGPAMSGVVGTRMPRFCLFGDTINTASRCESTCPPGAIHVSTSVRDLVPEEPWVPTGGVMAAALEQGPGQGPGGQGVTRAASGDPPTSVRVMKLMGPPEPLPFEGLTVTNVTSINTSEAGGATGGTTGCIPSEALLPGMPAMVVREGGVYAADQGSSVRNLSYDYVM